MIGFALGGCPTGGGSPRGEPSDSDGGTTSGGDTSISTTITVGDPSATDGSSSATGSPDSTGEPPTSSGTSGGTTAGLDGTSGSDGDASDSGGSSESGSTSTTGVDPVGVDDLVEGDLVITEVMYNPAFCTDAACEWIEIYNATDNPVDLVGLVLSDIGASSGEIEESAILPAGEYGVLATGDENSWGYSFTPLAHYGSTGPFFSQDKGDLVEIANAATTIDIILYTASGDLNAGASLELDPGSLDAVLNDDEDVWCVAQDDFGDGDFGSPGAANTTACQ
ncbi:MAG: lamin tail domain-containing protein [Myxococcota bacterium]